ncbi:hypothetical protein E1B28_013789 [Marasmius oreades]|uniref:Hydrophobin n=1 Tax=Marasmius oreades TaxID=181124 RepID=A0A9P7RQC0_9AGAR|nr:uncharacterized protein E1B28_013789 [Marasmius oreades]KAG7087851.1 hypothetical protein E1B28_013789 [Marasmius oreades]
MLFSTKSFAISALTLTSLAAATAIESRSGGIPNEQCPGLLCCQQTGYSTDSSIILGAGILDPLGLLGIVPIVLSTPVNVLLGLNCSPITGIGGDNGPCSQGTIVLCNDNSHAPWLSIGCFPITI